MGGGNLRSNSIQNSELETQSTKNDPLSTCSPDAKSTKEHNQCSFKCIIRKGCLFRCIIKNKSIIFLHNMNSRVSRPAACPDVHIKNSERGQRTRRRFLEGVEKSRTAYEATVAEKWRYGRGRESGDANSQASHHNRVPPIHAETNDLRNRQQDEFFPDHRCTLARLPNHPGEHSLIKLRE